MQILRCLPLACAAAVCFSPFLLHADTDAQQRAQDALDQKMQELNSQAATSTPAVKKPAPKPKPAAPAPAPSKPKPTPPAPQPTPIAVTPAPAPVVSNPAPAPVKRARVPEVASSTTPTYSAPPTNTGTENNDQLEHALQQKMNETQTNPAPSKPKKSKSKKPTSEPVPAANPAPTYGGPVASTPTPPPPANLPAMQGPSSHLTESQQHRLDQLLQQYRSDQITPAQYHEQRSKILSESK